MKTIDVTLVLAALTAATGAAAQDNSLNRPGSGARAAGMGNAFIAVSDDGTAASWNPAGLTQLRKTEFSLVQSSSWRNQFREGYRTLDRSTVFTTLKTPSTAVNLEFASAAWPLAVAGRPITVQFGWRRLYQFSGRLQGDISRIPVTAAGQPEARIRYDSRSDGNINLWTVAGAARVTSRLSAGWSVDFYHGTWREGGNVSEVAGAQGPTDFVATLTSNRIGGHTLNLGLLLAYPTVRVGVVYHGALNSKYQVTQSRRSNLSEPVDESFGTDGGIRLRFPRSVGLGVAWLPQPLLRLAVDLTYDEWTKFLVEGTPASPNRPISGFDELPPELSATRNTITLNAGLERLFPVKDRYLPLRLGVSREPQGGRDPLLRENSDQTILAAGTGLNSNNLKVDVALEHRWGSVRNTQDISVAYLAGRTQELGLPPSPEATGTARFREWRLKFSVIYRVTSAGKIWDVIRKPFGA